jgi:hypothetical protein
MKLAATLVEHGQEARLFLTLATLRTDALVGTVDDWRWTGPTAKLASWAERLGAPALAERARRVAERRGS